MNPSIRVYGDPGAHPHTLFRTPTYASHAVSMLPKRVRHRACRAGLLERERREGPRCRSARLALKHDEPALLRSERCGRPLLRGGATRPGIWTRGAPRHRSCTVVKPREHRGALLRRSIPHLVCRDCDLADDEIRRWCQSCRTSGHRRRMRGRACNLYPCQTPLFRTCNELATINIFWHTLACFHRPGHLVGLPAK